MSFGRYDWFSLLILLLQIHSIRSNLLLTKFNVTLTTPNKTSPTVNSAHKSIHVTYNLPDNIDGLSIVGIEPNIQLHQKIIEQLTVRICNSRISRTVGYDDEIECDDEQSMLIYQWIPSTSILPFYLCDECGFSLTESQTVILTVTYKIEKRVHSEQSGVTLCMSTNPMRFLMGTIIIGNAREGTRFSCRSSTSPRLFYAVKKLHFEREYFPWQISTIRNRKLSRKLIQSLVDSEQLSNRNQTNIEYLIADLFFISGDHLFLQCDNPLNKNCLFLLYYSYKIDMKSNDNRCQTNQFPKLFDLLPSRQTVDHEQSTTMSNSSDIETSTIFIIIMILFFSGWISIIIGCVIMRRIRGLVNFRTEPSSPFSSQKNRLRPRGKRLSNAHFNQRVNEIEQIMQMDGEHGGVTN